MNKSTLIILAALLALTGCAGQKPRIADRSQQTKAKQDIADVTVAGGDTNAIVRGKINTELAKAKSNFDELYANKADASCFVSESAFNACFELTWATGGSFDEAGDYTLTGEWDFSGATVTGLSGGSMTWPSSGGIAVYDGSSAWGTSIAASSLLVGDCTAGPCLDGTSDGGNIIKLWAGTGSYWTALQGGAPAANRSWRLPIAAPPSAGTTYLMNMDEYGQMGFLATSTYLTPSGVGGALTVTATGFDGNLVTTDNTLQEIAQKVDDLAISGLSVNPSASGQSLSSTGSGAGAYEWVTDTVMSANATSLVSAANYAAMRTLLDLEAGTDFNAYDADLTTWAGVTPGAGVATALAVNTGSAGSIARVIASGTSALGTSAISSGACASVVTTSATGVTTTDRIDWGFNTRISQVTGYAPSANGILTIEVYPTADNVNFEVCNHTAASITPGAVTLNWGVIR